MKHRYTFLLLIYLSFASLKLAYFMGVKEVKGSYRFANGVKGQ